MATIIGNEQWTDAAQQTQVYRATHDGEGNTLSSLDRSFISFSWGGENIEDFEMLVVSEGDRYSKTAYAPFSDSTTESEMLDGQKYWGTSFEANSLTFMLATDGMTEQTLQNFKNWFKPGIERELILAEHPNLGILARIAEPPSFSILPFEQSAEITIGTRTYTTTTTLWRGEISITFIMDDPFWYGITSYYTGVMLSEDEVRTIIEDGIPHTGMLKTTKTTFLSTNHIWTGSQIKINEGVSLAANNEYYLYNCGTGISKPILEFTFFVPLLGQSDTVDGLGTTYISFPQNSYAHSGQPYNVIQIGDHEFRFTTPGFLTSYNQAVKILMEDFKPGDSIIDLRKAFRDKISDFYVRTWVMALCEIGITRKPQSIEILNSNNSLHANYVKNFLFYMRKMFNFPDANDSGETRRFRCTINSETGEATVTFKIATLNLEGADQASAFDDMVNPELCTIVENIGDMIRSDYLIIDERTLPNSSGTITNSDCLVVKTDCELTNVKINYNYMYM